MPFPDYPPARVQAPKRAGAGVRIPEREADCSGRRPSWFPFAVNVCDCDDDPPPELYAGRQLRLPSAPPERPYPPGDPCAP